MSSAGQIALLLEEMKDVPEERRTARFVCSIALVGGGENLGGVENSGGGENPPLRQTFEGHCEGRIASAPRGEGGFGYDPIFIDEESGRTFAELSREEKAGHSHRGKALRAAREFIEKMMRG